jgi:hypothetical protein
VLTAKFRNRHTVLGLLEDRQYLAVGKRDFFMQNLPACSLRKILLLITAVFRGDYPYS